MTSMQTSPGQGGLPPNRAQLQELIGSMRVTQVIYVAAKLGIADQLKDGPKHIDELAATAVVDANALYRVLRALASQGIFAETGDCHFALTPQAELLRDDVPGSLRAWAMMLGGESCWKPWGELLECVKTGETAFHRVFGMGRWEYLAAHPDAAETFNRMSASNTEGRATPIVEAYDFSAATTVIDLGGGCGGLLAAILTKHPDVTGALTDLPAVVAEAQAFIDTQGLGERCAVVESDLLASIPQGGDIYVMKSVLHFLAYNLRYHGTAPWPDAGQHYSVATHAADLAGFIRQLHAGPVHLVGLSSGGRLVTMVALAHPDLVRSLTLAEPALAELLADLPEAKTAREELRQALELIRTTANAGEAVQAAKLFFEWGNNQGAGAFDKQPVAFRQMILDNARTVPLQLAAPRPPALSCATLGGVQAPTLVVRGAQTPHYLALISEVLVQCIPGSRLVVIPQATHLMSHQNPTAFNETLLQFLAQH